MIFINIGPINNFEKIKSGENFKNGEGGYVRLFCQDIQNRGPTYLEEEGLRGSERGLPTCFKEGLRTSKRACLL